MSNNSVFHVADEIREAVHANRPVVALESAIYTHGFPYPENVALASHLESIVRMHGAIPASIGVLDGVARVGMGPEELIKLASSTGLETTRKVSRRDLGFVCGLVSRGQKFHGGTTVAGTMILAHLAGIRIFCTGGLGGVHRGGEDTLDISADLTELGRTPVAVVSSGCKSFLDIPRTLEYLETQGVGVATFSDGREGDADFPAFWSRESGNRSPMTVATEAEAAAIIHSQALLSMSSGLLFANAIPEQHSISKSDMDDVIAGAIKDAQQAGASGKDNTPFVLRRIKELTSGKSVAANRALIESNIIRGTKVAVELAKLDQEQADYTGCDTPSPVTPFTSPTNMNTSTEREKKSGTSQGLKVTNNQQARGPQSADVAGSVALDLSCDYTPFSGPDLSRKEIPEFKTSNPSVISSTLGGVGRNVATAARLLGASVRLCSYVADDIGGQAALNMLQSEGLDTDQIKVLPTDTGTRTGQYIAVNDSKKDLVLAMADMSIFDNPELGFETTWKSILEERKPKWLVVDANWNKAMIRRWFTEAKAVGSRTVFEPVSAPKASRVFERNSIDGHLGVYPNHHIDVATPNVMELAVMYAAAQSNACLEEEKWWHVIDALGISSAGARDRLVSLTNASLVDQGIPQQSIQLLPYVPALITKLGPEGALLTQILAPDDPRLTSSSTAPHILSRSNNESPSVGGVYMRLFGPAEEISNADILSVNGVGDTLLGVLVAGLASDHRATLDALIPVAQRASVISLKSKMSVPPALGELRSELYGSTAQG
ncbi:MAG: hypothetical protein M1833_003500 [Piccolia ochrophora]|nr:MAG: hypothetical protein M1833_003500 [Piccolia ochrophora]